MLPKEVLEKKQTIIDYLGSLDIPVEKIQNEELMIQTFVHKSFAADYKQMLLHNERLEFLGDGILSAVTNKLLFISYPDYSEADLTLYKISLVREETLADVAKEINLSDYIFVSKGEEKMKGRQKNSILSDCLEALLGFLYIDLGSDVVEKFIEKNIFSKIANISKDPVKSYKTMLQEYVQKETKELPIYKDSEVDDKGNEVSYISEIYVGDQKISEGFGSSKKKAQEDAAKNYYLKIDTISG